MKPHNLETTPLGSILTVAEIRLALDLTEVKEIEEQIIRPALARINEKTGQENDARYLAYFVLHWCSYLNKED